jgi:cobalamin biosynthesis Mg chelatase CobN
MRAFLLQFGRATRRSLFAISATVLLALSPVAVRADNYGSGPYNSGVYSSSSSSSSGSGSTSSGTSSSPSGSTSAPASSSPTNESTVVQTDSGLQVAINLSDGQAIPSTGYYITITPLNGDGKSFDKAEIYLDGQLAYSGAPDSTGTLKWLWDTSKSPATKVKIIVYGPGSGMTTHEFNVTVSPVESAASNGQNSSATTSASSTSGATWPQWVVWSLVGFVVLVVLFVIWLVVRRRRNGQQVPPTSFTPM